MLSGIGFIRLKSLSCVSVMDEKGKIQKRIVVIIGRRVTVRFDLYG